ncbi:MAG: HU family DNA-binding protein [Desulfobacteraceae bacterium]
MLIYRAPPKLAGGLHMTLTKEKLNNDICERLGLPRSAARGVVESLLELMKSVLESGEDILITGFGKFCVNDNNVKRRRGFHTGDRYPVGARRVVTFKPSEILKRKLNGD